MVQTGRFRALIVLAAFALLTTACGGDGDGDKAATKAPVTTTRPLPASLASAKGWVAYSTFISGQDRLHLARVDGSEDHQVAPELPGEIIRADFSRDGKKLAFEYRPPNDVHQVYIANADGTNPQVVAKCEYAVCEHEYPAWSPDGKYLAVTGALGPAEGDKPPPVFAFGIIDVATQKVRYILKHPLREWGPELIRWSPDGRRLVFYASRSEGGGHPEWSELPSAEATIFTVKVDGTGLKQLTPWKLRCGDPDWSPDGSAIICTTRPPQQFQVGQGDIYSLKPDGSALRKLTKFGDNPRSAHARYTPDGKAILYIRAISQDWEAPPRHVYVLDPATGQDTPLFTKRDFYTRPSLQPTP